MAAWSAVGRLAIDTLGGSPQIVGLLPSLAWLGLAGIAGAACAMFAVSRGVPAVLFLLPSIGAIGWITLTTWPAIVAWAGPAIAFPFALLTTGIIVALMQGAPTSPPYRRASSPPALAGLLAAAWMGALLWAVTPLPVTGDEPHYLLATQSLLTDGDFELKNQYDTRTYRTFYPGILEPRHAVIGALGQEFPFHGLAVSVLALPPFALGGAPAVRVLMVIVAGVGAGFFWSAAQLLTRSTSSAWIAWVALISSAPFALHGISIYPDGIAAAIASIAAWALATIVVGADISVRASVGTGLALALLPWLHIRLSSVAGLLGMAILVAMYQRRRELMLPFMAAPIISFVLWIATSWVMFRTLDPTSIFRQKAAGSLAAMPTGILGLLFDAEYGLLVYAPIVAIAILGIPSAWRRSPVITASTTLLTMTTLGVGGAWVWWGGDSAPARFLVPVLPLICLWLAAWWADAHIGARSFAGALIVFGACLTMLFGIAERGLYLTNVPDGRGTLFDWISPNVDLTLALPSLFRPGATTGTEAIVAASWLFTGVLVFGVCTLWTRRRAMDRVSAWLTASIAALAWVTFGTSLGWWWHGAVPWTPDRGQLRLLHAATSPVLDVAVRAPALQLVSREAALSSLRIAMPLPDASTALHVPFAPAGRYTVSIEPASSPTALLSLELGRAALPFATWPAHDASQAPAFSLAAPVYSVRVVATQGAKAEAGVVRLQPHAVTAPPLVSEIAMRVTRYGELAVYFFDSYSYPQADGFWLAADRTGHIAIADLDGRMASAVMTITAQDAPTSIRISKGTFEHTVTLAPRATERLVLPREPENALVWFTVTGGSSLQAGDGRRLGVFVRVSRD